jgi:hypothetical protein
MPVWIEAASRGLDRFNTRMDHALDEEHQELKADLRCCC